MKSQLQKISLRLQTHRTNEQMMTAMKGATVALGSMNRSMNLPALQRIAMEFERENDIMEQRQVGTGLPPLRPRQRPALARRLPRGPPESSR